MLSILILFGFFTLLSYSNGGINTSSLYTYTLTNGYKTVVYQEMMHIGLRSFYEEVGKEIKNYRNDGYQILFEGIGATGYKSLKKGDIGYDEAILKFKSYESINQKMFKDRDAKSVFNNTPFMYQSNSVDLMMQYDDEYADLSYETIDKIGVDHVKKNNILTDNSDPLQNTDFDYSFTANMLVNNQKLALYFMNGVNSSILKWIYYSVEYILQHTFPAYSNILYEAVQGAREKNLADTVLNESNKFIYINYGANHFRGFLSHLKDDDPNWKIISTTKKIVLKSN